MKRLCAVQDVEGATTRKGERNGSFPGRVIGGYFLGEGGTEQKGSPES